MVGLHISKGFKDYPGVIAAFFPEALNEASDGGRHHLKQDGFCHGDFSTHKYRAVLLIEPLAGSSVWSSTSSSPTVSNVNQLSKSCAHAEILC